MTSFNAITINPATRTVTATKMDDENQLDQFYAQIGCRNVDALELPNGDTAWIDDEGLFVQGQSFFSHPDLLNGQPIAGIAIVTGTAWDDKGDKLENCKSTVDELLASAQWLTCIQAANCAV